MSKRSTSPIWWLYSRTIAEQIYLDALLLFSVPSFNCGLGEWLNSYVCGWEMYCTITQPTDNRNARLLLVSFTNSPSAFLLELTFTFKTAVTEAIVGIVPTDQIPHDLRRICNSKLVNQLSKYNLKFICFGKVSYNFRKILSKAV